MLFRVELYNLRAQVWRDEAQFVNIILTSIMATGNTLINSLLSVLTSHWMRVKHSLFTLPLISLPEKGKKKLSLDLWFWNMNFTFGSVCWCLLCVWYYLGVCVSFRFRKKNYSPWVVHVMREGVGSPSHIGRLWGIYPELKFHGCTVLSPIGWMCVLRGSRLGYLWVGLLMPAACLILFGCVCFIPIPEKTKSCNKILSKYPRKKPHQSN